MNFLLRIIRTYRSEFDSIRPERDVLRLTLLCALIAAALLAGFLYGAMHSGERVAREIEDTAPSGHFGTVITREEPR